MSDLPPADLPNGFMELSLLLYAADGTFLRQVCEDPHVLRPGTSPIVDVHGYSTVRIAADSIARYGMQIDAEFRLIHVDAQLRYAFEIKVRTDGCTFSHVQVEEFTGFCTAHVTVTTPGMAPELSRVVIACSFHHVPVLPPFLRAQLDDPAN